MLSSFKKNSYYILSFYLLYFLTSGNLKAPGKAKNKNCPPIFIEGAMNE